MKAGIYPAATKINLIRLWRPFIVWLNTDSIDKSKSTQKGRFLGRLAEFFYSY